MPQTQSRSDKNGRNRLIASLVAKLLGHYWTADEPARLRQAQIEDWVEDLNDFDPGVVEQACRDWRRGSDRRPVPSEIRRMCIEEETSRAERKQLGRRGLSETEITQTADAWAQSHGFASMADMQHSPTFTGAMLQIGPGQFRRINPVTDHSAERAA